MNAAPEMIAPDSPLPATPPRRILLLEDDPSYKQIVALFLREHGYEVVTASNGVEGVRELVNSDFEVIICDMMMPTVAGDMFFVAVQRMRPHLCSRFIFITGHSNNPQIDEFIQRVKGTILTKPFHVNDLLEMIGFVQVKVLLSAA
jgi:DNA-binding response OmpR family regulator